MASPLSYRTRQRALAGACAAVAIATAAAASGFTAAQPAPAAATISRSTAVTTPRYRVGAGALGVNVAPWDYSYGPGDKAAPAMQRMLKSAGVGMLHYGGGMWADYYDWQTNTDIKNCLPYHADSSFTSSCSTGDALGFANFSRQARALGAASFVTVNYGSGTPALAADWVAAARTTQGEAVRLWEVGNESYGCWEVNNPLASAPANYQGYVPNHWSTCPQITQGSARGTQTLANSYAAHALKFLQAMKSADSSAQIGVPWAFGSDVHGAAVPYADEWNRTVLRAAGRYASFVDARWYPYLFSGATGGRNPTSTQVLRQLFAVPALYRQMRQTLNAYDPKAGVVLGETGITSTQSLTVCQPVGAVFAAGDVLSWLAAGASSVDWFDLNNYGNKTPACKKADFGLFTSSVPPVPETPYWGYLLASKLAVPGATLGAVQTSAPKSVLAYESVLPGGRRAIALVNTGAAQARDVRIKPFRALTGPGAGPGGRAVNLKTWTYSIGTPRIVAGTARAGAVTRPGVTLPAESVRVMESG